MAIVPHKHNAAWRNPFYEMEKLHRDMNRLFDLSYPSMNDPNASLLEGIWSPAVDVIERPDAIVLKAELPGLSKEDIDITVENNLLTIRGEKKQETERAEGEVVRSERFYGMFHRAFTLPTTANPENVNAKFEKGILELTIGKKEEAKPKQIKIDVK